jgi:hypothetical protein
MGGVAPLSFYSLVLNLTLFTLTVLEYVYIYLDYFSVSKFRFGVKELVTHFLLTVSSYARAVDHATL